jgi:hypothetical protein
MCKKITSGYLRQNAELSGVFICIDGVEYRVDTSELDLNHIIDDISMAGDDNNMSKYLHKVMYKNQGGNNE